MKTQELMKIVCYEMKRITTHTYYLHLQWERKAEREGKERKVIERRKRV